MLKISSTDANWGEYVGRYIIMILLIIIVFFEADDLWDEQYQE